MLLVPRLSPRSDFDYCRYWRCTVCRFLHLLCLVSVRLLRRQEPSSIMFRVPLVSSPPLESFCLSLDALLAEEESLSSRSFCLSPLLRRVSKLAFLFHRQYENSPFSLCQTSLNFVIQQRALDVSFTSNIRQSLEIEGSPFHDRGERFSTMNLKRSSRWNWNANLACLVSRAIELCFTVST